MNEPVAVNHTTGKSIPVQGLGLGLRHCHADQILAGEARVNWFEAISENYMDSGGKSLYILRQVAEQYPIVLHGVSMSIGSADPLDFDYLEKLKRLAAEVSPQWLSDHLCWTGIHGINTHDLLPVPLTEETLAHIVTRVNIVQDFLQRRLVLENPSTYVRFSQSTLSEPEFLAELTAATECGLLLDVNNVYVSSYNADTDPMEYFASFPFEHVVQMHLAGHEDCGTHVIDTHDRPVRKEVWELFRHAWTQTAGAPTCLEWDGQIPSLAECEAEIFKALDYINTPVDQKPEYKTTPVESNGISTPIGFLVPNVMDNTTG